MESYIGIIDVYNLYYLFYKYKGQEDNTDVFNGGICDQKVYLITLTGYPKSLRRGKLWN